MLLDQVVVVQGKFDRSCEHKHVFHPAYHQPGTFQKWVFLEIEYNRNTNGRKQLLKSRLINCSVVLKVAGQEESLQLVTGQAGKNLSDVLLILLCFLVFMYLFIHIVSRLVFCFFVCVCVFVLFFFLFLSVYSINIGMSPEWSVGAFRHFRLHIVNSSFSCIISFWSKAYHDYVLS